MLRFFTFSQQNAPSLQIYITIPKTFGFVKKTSRNKHHFRPKNKEKTGIFRDFLPHLRRFHYDRHQAQKHQNTQ